MYLSLTQSNADENRLVVSIHPPSYPIMTGVPTWRSIKGMTTAGWSPRSVWTNRLASPVDPTQIAVTGAGSPDQFRTLASATQSQLLLPAR